MTSIQVMLQDTMYGKTSWTLLCLDLLFLCHLKMSFTNVALTLNQNFLTLISATEMCCYKVKDTRVFLSILSDHMMSY
jgi:hypothetical protein